MDERYLSRKFILAAFVIVAAVPLLIYNILPAAFFNPLVMTTLGLYFTGNVAATVANTPAK